MTTNEKLLLLFVILLLGLILCSFLGGRGCSKEGFTSSTTSDPMLTRGSDGNFTVHSSDTTTNMTTGPTQTSLSGGGWDMIIDPNTGDVDAKDQSGSSYMTDLFTFESPPSTSSSSSSSSSSNNTQQSPTLDSYDHYSGTSATTYYGDNGTATVSNVDGQGKLVTVNNNGSIKLYYIPNSGNSGQDTNSSNSSNSSSNSSSSSTATITTNGNGNAIIKVTTTDNGSTTTDIYSIDRKNNQNQSQSVDSTINQYDANTTSGLGSDYNNSYMYNGNGINAAAITGPGGNTAAAVTGPAGNTYVGTNANTNSSAYYNSLPPGIGANQIPPGQEDLYILKSQVVPPVCPKCPDPIVRSSDSPDLTKCPPCPPCARCPEPAFDCKKVPNYNAFNANYMPVPVVSDFSGFGM